MQIPRYIRSAQVDHSKGGRQKSLTWLGLSKSGNSETSKWLTLVDGLPRTGKQMRSNSWPISQVLALWHYATSWTSWRRRLPWPLATAQRGSPADQATSKATVGLISSPVFSQGCFHHPSWVNHSFNGNRLNRSSFSGNRLVCQGKACELGTASCELRAEVMTLCSQLLWAAPPSENFGAMLLGQARASPLNSRARRSHRSHRGVDGVAQNGSARANRTFHFRFLVFPFRKGPFGVPFFEPRPLGHPLNPAGSDDVAEPKAGGETGYAPGLRILRRWLWSRWQKHTWSPCHSDARRVLVACNIFAAAQCLYQTGVEVPAALSRRDCDRSAPCVSASTCTHGDAEVVERVAHYLPPGVAWGNDMRWKEAAAK